MSQVAREYLDKHLASIDELLQRLRQEQAAAQQRATDLAAMIEHHEKDRDEAVKARDSLGSKVRKPRG